MGDSIFHSDCSHFRLSVDCFGVNHDEEKNVFANIPIYVRCLTCGIVRHLVGAMKSSRYLGFFRNNKGSVTMFVSMTLTATIILNLILLDVLKINTAKRELAMASNSATRSVMSRFSSDMSAYGLFGVASKDPLSLQIATDVMSNQLNLSDISVSHHLKFDSMLASEGVFLKQLHESMKWRLPATLLKEMFTRWNQQSVRQTTVGTAALSSSNSVKLEAYAMREKLTLLAVQRLLKEAEKHWQQSRDQALEYLNQIIEELTMLQQLEQTVMQLAKPFQNREQSTGPTNDGPLALLIQTIEQRIADAHQPVDDWFFKTNQQLERAISTATNKTNEQQSLKQQFQDIVRQTLIINTRFCPNTSGAYQQLKRSIQNIRTFNQTTVGRPEALTRNHTNPYVFINKAKARSQTLIALISKGWKPLKENLYLNEFAIAHFNSRLDLQRGGASLTSPESHRLQNQEVEFVISGLYSCDASQAFVMAELFLLRMGLRTLEFFSNPQLYGASATKPWLLVLSALAYGGSKAYSDCKQLTEGEAVPLIEWKQRSLVSLNYLDHLRLLMLLVPRGKKIERIQALLEQNTGLDLTTTATSVELTAQASVPLRMFFKRSISLTGTARHAY